MTNADRFSVRPSVALRLGLSQRTGLSPQSKRSDVEIVDLERLHYGD